jgi:hypothetical protein
MLVLLRPLRAARAGSVAALLLLSGSSLVWCARTETKPPPADVFIADGGIGNSSGLTPPGPGTEPGGCGFPGTPASFTIPVLAEVPPGTFKGASGDATCSGGKPFHYDLRDMDGDQQPDLVVSAACDDSTIGVSAWRVYTNTGTGFDPTPKRFTLPVPAIDPTCMKSTLADVDGDLKPDLVVTSSCSDTTVGTTRWIVYRNGGTGFEPLAPYALPPGVVVGAYVTLGPTPAACSTTNAPGFAFFDIDGDRKGDLVVTTACDAATIGTTAWRVYTGNGNGVAATPALFTLPTTPAIPLGTYASPTGGDADCTTTPVKPQYSVFDFDGDFKPDLLVTRDCTDATIGTTHWNLYRNSGTGFPATPEPIALPVVEGAAVRPLAALSGQPACGSSPALPGYSTLDSNGDLKPDLLFTRSCTDALSGITHWLIYKNGDAGLSTTAEQFSLPVALGGSVTSPLVFTSAEACAGTPLRPAYFTSYLVKLTLDVIVTSQCNDPTVGTSRWLLYQGSCP